MIGMVTARVYRVNIPVSTTRLELNVYFFTGGRWLPPPLVFWFFFISTLAGFHFVSPMPNEWQQFTHCYERLTEIGGGFSVLFCL